MAKLNTLLLLAVCLMSVSSCEAIGGIFKAGVWVGILIVVVIIAVLMLLFRKRS